jgi:hypothetical protein
MDLDRATDGIDRKCCDCARPFRGHAWMDYCAECNAKNEAASPLRKRWACLTCNTTFEAGKIISGPRGWQCPSCRGLDLSPAHGERRLDRYDGDDVTAMKN